MKIQKTIIGNLAGVFLFLVLAGMTSMAASIGESDAPIPSPTVPAGEAVGEIEQMLPEIPAIPTIPSVPDVTEILEKSQTGFNMFSSDRVGPNEIRQGDMVIFGGTGEVEGRVTGDLVVFGGSARVSGDVGGDVVVFGGSANLEPTARIDGEVVVIGGVINREEGSIVQGEVVVIGGSGMGMTDKITIPDFRGWKRNLNFTLLLTWLVLAFIITLLFTRPVENTAEIVISRPFQALLTGFVFHVVALLICLILTVIILGIPLAFLGVLLWLLISVFGTTVGFVVMGHLVWEKIRKGYTNTLLILLTGFIILAVMRFVPFFIGWTLWQLWGMAGIGATVISRFGSNKPWFSSKQNPAPAPVPPEPPLPPAPLL